MLTQYATPALIEAIAYAGHDPADDPAWPDTGAASHAEYATWCRHVCGMACLAMILGHRDAHTPPVLDLLRASLPYGVYQRCDDNRIRGMFYAPFVDYIRAQHGLAGQSHPDLPLDQLTGHLAAGATLVLASVHKEIRRPDRTASGRGGHLVLVTGYDPARGSITFHNPSGHTPTARAANLPTEVFATFYAARGVTVTLN